MSEGNLSRGERSRAAIVRAAHALFVQQGYHGTSMRQIASEAGIALGGVYNHFDSKADVFETVFLEYHPYHQVLPLLLDVQGETVEDRVGYAADQMVKAIQERPDFLNLMFIEVVEFKSVHAGELFSTIIPQSVHVVQRVVEGEQERLRPIPVPMLIRSFLGLFFSYFLTEILLASNAPEEFREDAMRYMVDIYLHGILADDKY